MSVSYMNFVYYSKESYIAVVKNHIKYIYGEVDIRDYLSEESIKSLKDIVISSNGGSIRVLSNHDKIPTNRRYQVINKFTQDSDLKSKYVLICPIKMSWNASELMSEGKLVEGENYLEIYNENGISEMDLLELASNLSYMYGVRFSPHTVEYGSLYRITLDDKNKSNVWKDISSNVKEIKKSYKFENISVNKVKKPKKIVPDKVSISDFENVKY